MAINFDSLVIDRVLNATAENSTGDVLYLLNNLSAVSINGTSQSKDKTDSVGTLIKRFYTAKTIDFSAETSLMSLALMATQFGTEKEVATDAVKISTPKFHFIPGGSTGTVTLPQTPSSEVTKIYAVDSNGTLGKAYTKATAASATEFAITGAEITLPTVGADEKLPQLFVKYEYDSATAVRVVNKSDKFPSTVALTLSVLVSDTCDVDVVRHAYIVFPSFQVSPDVTISLDTESTFPFSGIAQVDYCAEDKNLYYVILSEEDVA